MAGAVVIGGGPSGCAAALTFRAAGVDTTLVTLDRPRLKPTETAAPPLWRLLRSLGAESALDACEPCYGVESDWGATDAKIQSAMLAPLGHAWFIHRHRFDAILLQHAEAAGTVILHDEVTEAGFSDKDVIVDTLSRSLVTNRLVIATGSPKWAADITGQRPSRSDVLVCHWAHLDAPIASRLLHVETTTEGWWYLCPAETGDAVACFVTDARGSRRHGASRPDGWQASFRNTRLCRDHALDVAPSRVRSLTASVSQLRSRLGTLWAAAGDAAVRLDPVGSVGATAALESGMLAARALLSDETDPARNRYTCWSEGLWNAFQKRAALIYQVEAKKHPCGFWTRRVATRTDGLPDSLVET